jgi:hypothetical protein
MTGCRRGPPGRRAPGPKRPGVGSLRSDGVDPLYVPLEACRAGSRPHPNGRVGRLPACQRRGVFGSSQEGWTRRFTLRARRQDDAHPRGAATLRPRLSRRAGPGAHHDNLSSAPAGPAQGVTNPSDGRVPVVLTGGAYLVATGTRPTSPGRRRPGRRAPRATSPLGPAHRPRHSLGVVSRALSAAGAPAGRVDLGTAARASNPANHPPRRLPPGKRNASGSDRRGPAGDR